MTSTTPTSTGRNRSTSRTRLPSRPTTPLRPSSRTSLRNSQQASTAAQHNPLDALESQFAELSDGMADLEANFMHVQLMHESLARFSESFAAFLYGLNMNAFCVDFPEAPIPESFKRAAAREASSFGMMGQHGQDVEATFLCVFILFWFWGQAAALPSILVYSLFQTNMSQYYGYFVCRKPARVVKGLVQILDTSPSVENSKARRYRRPGNTSWQWHC